jgi:hypothetical protein
VNYIFISLLQKSRHFMENNHKSPLIVLVLSHMESMPSNSIPLRFISILSSKLTPRSSNGIVSWRLTPKQIMPFCSFQHVLNSPIILLFSYSFTWLIFGEIYKLRSFSLCIFLHPHAISFPLCPSTLLNTPLSIILAIYSFLLWHKTVSFIKTTGKK